MRLVYVLNMSSSLNKDIIIIIIIIRSRYERYAVHTSRLRGILTATYVWRIRSMSYVSTTYLPRCFRMCHVCVTYVRRIGPATYVLRIFKCTHKKVAPRRMRSMSYVS